MAMKSTTETESDEKEEDEYKTEESIPDATKEDFRTSYNDKFIVHFTGQEYHELSTSQPISDSLKSYCFELLVSELDDNTIFVIGLKPGEDYLSCLSRNGEIDVFSGDREIEVIHQKKENRDVWSK